MDLMCIFLTWYLFLLVLEFYQSLGRTSSKSKGTSDHRDTFTFPYLVYHIPCVKLIARYSGVMTNKEYLVHFIVFLVYTQYVQLLTW